MPPVRSIGRAPGRPHAPVRNVQGGPRAFDPVVDLPGPTAEEWEAISEEMRMKRLQSIDSLYKQYVARFYETANLCVTRHDACVRNHKLWRYAAIVGTGLLACLNFVSAKTSFGVGARSSFLPIVASIAALILAMLANLETFANSAERAQAYRESRELYLDAAEEYDRAWSVAVIPLGATALGYANAMELYRRIVSEDKVLRRSFRELSKQSK